ncbi:hypothetical protein NKI51_02810 [Mesorhizobium australicum]|uniref:hypothetical protein n=1 Tax=Mesorhizobium australicum TaxID=536018 RepID=UPI003338D255
MISAVVKSWQQGGLPKLVHIVRNSTDFIKERVSPFSAKPGIFSQKIQACEHRTPPDRPWRRRAAIRDVGEGSQVFNEPASTDRLRRYFIRFDASFETSPGNDGRPSLAAGGSIYGEVKSSSACSATFS